MVRLSSLHVRVRLSAIALLLLGCGGGGGHSTSDAANAPAVLGPDTVVLSSTDARQITATSDDSVTISGDTSAIHPGSIVASTQGEGLLRKVTSVGPSGASTTFQTVPASLEDAIQSISQTDERTLSAADIESFEPGGDGISMEGRGRDGGAGITLNLAKYELASGDSGKVSLSGSVGLSINLATQLQMKLFSVKKFSEDVSIGANASVTLEGSVALSLQNKKIRLGTLKGTPFLFGGVVMVQPVITVYSVLNGSVEDGFTLTTEASVTGVAGVKYENGNWSTSHSVKRSINVTPSLNLSSSLSVDYTPTRCELSLLIDGAASPYVNLDAPKYSAKLQVNTDEDELELAISRSVDAEVGVKVAILSHNLVDKSFSIGLEAATNFYDQTFPLGSSSNPAVVATATQSPNGGPAVQIKWDPNAFLKGSSAAGNGIVRWQVYREGVSAPIFVIGNRTRSVLYDTVSNVSDFQEFLDLSSGANNGAPAPSNMALPSAPPLTPGTSLKYSVEGVYAVSGVDLPGAPSSQTYYFLTPRYASAPVTVQ